MTYTNEEYAEMAIKANESGKVLKEIKGKLTLVEPEPMALTNEQLITQNKAKQNSLVSEANEKIAVLQDSIDLNMQEQNADEKLKQWKKYRILLTRIDTSDVNAMFPDKP